MRKASFYIVLVIFVAVGTECVSSYTLFRHFAGLHRTYSPTGLATVALVHELLAKAHGRHNEVDLSIDHGPLFHADPVLGYSMYPGSYQILEKVGGQSHQFSLTVDELGRRITSFEANTATRRLFIAGDSSMFGWGLDDEQTVPWLLQARFPDINVVNLSLTSYSTVQTMLQLDRATPPITPEDIILFTYHPITNGFNVASAQMLFYLRSGFEQKLGDPDLVSDMTIPFGSVNPTNDLVIDRFQLACGEAKPAENCDRLSENSPEAINVTKRTFDTIMAAHPAHYIVAFLSGPDSDPVITYLKSKGVLIADLRTALSDPDANDEVFTDQHAGPFWHHMQTERLAVTLRDAHWVEPAKAFASGKP